MGQKRVAVGSCVVFEVFVIVLISLDLDGGRLLHLGAVIEAGLL